MLIPHSYQLRFRTSYLVIENWMKNSKYISFLGVRSPLRLPLLLFNIPILMLVYTNVGHDLDTWSSKNIYIIVSIFLSWSEEPAKAPAPIIYLFI